MLIRTHRVTNSSSSAFIAWGLVVKNPVGDMLGDLLEDESSPVEPLFDSNEHHTFLFIKESYQDLGEDDDPWHGIMDIGELILKHQADQDEWEKQIQKVCDDCGIKMVEKPSWFYSFLAP